ncbi:7-carboxy-7-deazaguanine synthase QueE [Wenzhouxiangella marina]|uniref:7-carboxy-7-deazaguanine synthase n=1 Tax=Wenzhouxiangella marina TaxID=1579979 RepID=A0A0K0XT64_9GAMM|nr:7-carboxy-7-deazaguanine synthase QueE [Wenzhouxiangella marina]AKS40904.1 7-carboxy-7-deazaguanine synthase [Wenzhouxiangella marina]MBB6087778.1 7-carboxy-7-deazaguanine synthase [Wenzhouxiangella marina]
MTTTTLSSRSEQARTDQRLKITEIFTSIQGESDLSGWPTVFVRLTGCPLRCSWCDTPYSFHGGDWMQIDDIVDQARSARVRHVCVTGGEPLAQKRCLNLLTALCDAGFVVSLETSGALSVAEVDPRVVKVLDLKAPGSGEVGRNDWGNLDHLQAHDQIKLVLADRVDFDWALRQVEAHRLDRWQVLFSPVWGQLEPRQLAEWIVEARAHVRLQLQMHKYLWGEAQGR